jgi:hydrogenase maturation protein HypF
MIVARRIRVTGVVQGVGYRPFVWRLAREYDLVGWVRNDGAGVDLEVEGPVGQVDAFLAALKTQAPPLAQVDGVQASGAKPQGRSGFAILESAGGRASTAIGHDTAVCRDCMAELFDPANRRWRHAFITCTHCGPRYTVTRGLPYDRERTSLAPFPLCPECAVEYADPADRRFHAETTCCPKCGPQLTLLDANGIELAGDPISETLALLRQGRIVAIKGLGGFHLACDARSASAVAALRQRKQREEKPFAVMVANVMATTGLAMTGDAERALLESAERPIVLLLKAAGADAALPGVAPGLAWLGVVLPYTPLQWLLFHEAAERPLGTAWLAERQELALVMTSANPNGEPLVIGNEEARQRLAGIADGFLVHDRDIVVRCDDSVLRLAGEAPQFIRRARGFTPRAIKLPTAGPPVLALGGWYKNTICVTRGFDAFVSQHVGDLDNAAGCGFLKETVEHLLGILEVEPQVVACDLHPDFHSSRFAAAFAAERGLPLVRVQHHHAHGAAVLAEHGHTGPALVLALDGVGLGTDGASIEPPRSLPSLPPRGAEAALGRPGGGLWGGELLLLEGGRFERLGSLLPLGLPGGDRAAREPWRMAAAALHALDRGDEITVRFADEPAVETVAAMLARGINCPPTSSAGRLFDAAAGLLGVRRVMAFEGQAAMLLEGLAAAQWPAEPLAGGWVIAGDGYLDLRPLLASLVDDTKEMAEVGMAAARFHATLAAALVDWVGWAAARTGVNVVAGGGGCFLNALLSGALRAALPRRGVNFLEARQLSPNDGGLSLGQAWVALQMEY